MKAIVARCAKPAGKPKSSRVVGPGLPSGSKSRRVRHIADGGSQGAVFDGKILMQVSAEEVAQSAVLHSESVPHCG